MQPTHFSRTTVRPTRFREAILSDSSTGGPLHTYASVKMLGQWKRTDALPSSLRSVPLDKVVLIPSTSVIHYTFKSAASITGQ